LPELDPEQFERRPVDGIIVAFNAPIFLGRHDLVDAAWSALKPGGHIAVAGGRIVGPLGKAFGLVGPLMLRLAGHPQDWRYWDPPEPWRYLQELASGELHVELTLSFWFFVWARKPA
jgi:hypothetical protein